MTAAARIMPPTPSDLTTAQSTQPGGAFRLIQAYVGSLRTLFLEAARVDYDGDTWLALEAELREQHLHQWAKINTNPPVPGVEASLNRLGASEVVRLGTLLAAAPGGDGPWRLALTDLERDSANWELHASPTLVAFSLYAAVGWIGLRCAHDAGVSPQSLRQTEPVARPTPPRPTPVPTVAAHAVELARRKQEPDPVSRQPASPPSPPATQPRRQLPMPLGARSVADGTVTLEGAGLHKSVIGTWITLVCLSWVALFWGGVISAPVGVGFGILATAFLGIVAVPLWATVWGLVGMNAARSSTLDSLGLAPMADDHVLAAANAEFAMVLGIPTPRLCTVNIFNALAMGTSHKDATVALGTPLLEHLDTREAAAVLGHELGHVVSGDMRRMMLMRTFQNAMVWFMMFQGMKQVARWIICWAAELYILAQSRHREYWADAIGASLAGKDAMIGALRKLEQAPALTGEENTHARFMVRGRPSGWFSTHPSFDERITALENEDFIRRLPLR